MRVGLFGGAVLLLAIATPVASQAIFHDENIVVPLPAGFRPGFRSSHDGMNMTEFVPAAETVDNWSRMITEQSFYRLARTGPDALPRGMARRWSSDCPGGSASRVRNTQENGYPVSIWMFLCPSNPATGEPENMWMKVIAASDSLYSVQYAYRTAVSKEMATSAMKYLHSVVVCDTRQPAHPCPELR